MRFICGNATHSLYDLKNYKSERIIWLSTYHFLIPVIHTTLHTVCHDQNVRSTTNGSFVQKHHHYHHHHQYWTYQKIQFSTSKLAGTFCVNVKSHESALKRRFHAVSIALWRHYFILFITSDIRTELWLNLLSSWFLNRADVIDESLSSKRHSDCTFRLELYFPNGFKKGAPIFGLHHKNCLGPSASKGLIGLTLSFGHLFKYKYR